VTKTFFRTFLIDDRTIHTFALIGHDPEMMHITWREFEDSMIKKEATLEMGSLGSSNFTLIAKFVSSQPPLFATEVGYLLWNGTSVLYTRLGDMLVVFDGDATPFLLRQVKPNDPSDHSGIKERDEEHFSPEEQYELIRECYVHEAMDNEVVAPEWGAKRKSF
jgi:hypothetical protein